MAAVVGVFLLLLLLVVVVEVVVVVVVVVVVAVVLKGVGYKGRVWSNIRTSVMAKIKT